MKSCRAKSWLRKAGMQHIEFQRGAINAGDCIGNAWEMLKRNYGMFLGISLVAYLLIACVPCLNFFILGPVMGGVYYVALRDMRSEPVEFGMMFKGFEKFMPLMVIGLIQSIPSIIAQILQSIFQFSGAILDTRRTPDFDFFQDSGVGALGAGIVMIAVIVGLVFLVVGLLWWGAFFFAVPLAMEYDLGPMEAIKLSAQAGMSNIGGLIVLLIFEILVGLLGVLLICIGMFLISIPVVFIANAFAYRQVFPYLGGQKYNMNPPPPSAYGDFGTRPL